SVTPYADLQVIALPHATESWEHYRNDLALFQPQQGTLGEHSYFGCIGDGCRADVLQGETWVSMVIAGHRSDAARDTLLSEVVGLVGGVEFMGERPTAAQPETCEALLPA